MSGRKTFPSAELKQLHKNLLKDAMIFAEDRDILLDRILRPRCFRRIIRELHARTTVGLDDFADEGEGFVDLLPRERRKTGHAGIGIRMHPAKVVRKERPLEKTRDDAATEVPFDLIHDLRLVAVAPDDDLLCRVD